MTDIELPKKDLIFETRNYRIPHKRSKLNDGKIVKTYIKNNFRVIDTCKQLKITPETWYEWQNKFPELKYKISMAKESLKDDIEKTLLEKAKGGDTQLLLYLAKTMLKDRGYGVEKGENQNQNNTQVNIVLPEDTTKKYEWWGGKPDKTVNTDE